MSLQLMELIILQPSSVHYRTVELSDQAAKYEPHTFHYSKVNN